MVTSNMRDKIPASVGDRLKQSREALGLTQAKIAELSAVSLQTITNVEIDSYRALPAEAIFAIADVLQINPRWLATGHGDIRVLAPIAVSVPTTISKPTTVTEPPRYYVPPLELGERVVLILNYPDKDHAAKAIQAAVPFLANCFGGKILDVLQEERADLMPRAEHQKEMDQFVKFVTLLLQMKRENLHELVTILSTPEAHEMCRS